jgi:arylsulfatase A-like enzyme
MLLDRRGFLLGSLALKKVVAPAPNILLIVAGDLGTWMLGCAGNPDIKTPNIDLLAKQGTLFGASFTGSPAPAPGRGTLLSGRSRESKTTLSDVLAGYNSGNASATGSAEEFLDQQSAGKPFLLTVTYVDPLPASEAAKFEGLYTKSTFENMGRDPASPRAIPGKELPKDIVGWLRKRAAAISALDAQIPPLLAKLQARGLRENTLIVFSSTNGVLLGRHGLWGDGESSNPVNMYEEVVRVPTIWNWPGRVPVESVRNELVSHYDLLPSLCEVASVAAPAGLIGRSYAAVAFGRRLPKKQPWRSLVYGQLRDTRMVRDTRYKLVAGTQGPNELYDLAVDPRERINRFDNPGHLSVREQLMRQMAIAVARQG